MNNLKLLSVFTFVFGFAAFMYLIALVFNKKTAGKTGTIFTVIGVFGITAGIIMRWVESYNLGIGHAPLTNLYESLIFFAWIIAVVYLFFEFKFKSYFMGGFAISLSFLLMAYASLSPNINSRILPLIPALQSNWLITHVVTCFIGYASFGIAFGISFIYLYKLKIKDKRGIFAYKLPDPDILNELNYKMIMFGFLFLTIGIITGSVWANSAWGRYWGWDPKETWSLITWFVYATLMHARMTRDWNGKKVAWLSIIGFIAVLFTYFGVNYLPGLHSYGAMK